MRRSNLFVRTAAVVSSLLLVGGLIGYQTGAFGWGPTARPTTDDPGTPDTDKTMLPGSKVKQFDWSIPTEPTTPTLMPGSKSIAISPVVPAPPPPPPVVLSGSKSSFGPLVVPPGERQPTLLIPRGNPPVELLPPNTPPSK